MNSFIDFIQRDDPLHAEEQQAILALSKPVSFKKGDFIYKAQGVANDLFILLDGLARGYYLFDDKEVNTRLFSAPAFVVAFSSFINQQPSDEYIECVTDCSGFMFNYTDAVNSNINSTRMEFFSRRMAEKHYLMMERRLLMVQHKTGAERYADFLEHMEADIIEKMPSYHIASYLGITPESFSRLKNKSDLL